MLLKRNAIKRHWPLVCGLAFYASAILIHSSSEKPAFEINREFHTLLPRANVTRYLDLGLHRSIADILWIHTLMESDLTHYNKGDLRSWMYLRLREIVTLDRKFWEAYYYGAQYLMIIKDDLAGAEDLLLRGIEHYPNDFKLNFKLGYLYAIEMRDPQKAFQYFEKIKNDPERPEFFDSLLSKMAYSKLDLPEVRNLIADTLAKHTRESPLYSRLRHQLYTVQAMIDLKCLNEGRKDCARRDYYGFEYRLENGQWISAERLMDLKLNYK